MMVLYFEDSREKQKANYNMVIDLNLHVALRRIVLIEERKDKEVYGMFTGV